MTDVIELLERIGQDPHLRHGPRSEVELALAGAGITSEVQLAILAQDQTTLEMLLGQRPLCAIFMPGKEDEEPENDDDGEGESESEEIPSHEQSETPKRNHLQTVVVAEA